jgi:hypothetical protein
MAGACLRTYTKVWNDDTKKPPSWGGCSFGN